MTSTEKEFLDVINGQQERILRICRNYSTGTAERDDLFQEVMFNLWKSFGSFRGDSSRSTWVYRVALYTCMAHYRKRKRTDEATDTFAKEYADEAGDSGQRQYELLQEELRKLKEIDRAILILYLEERTYAEMASIIGISETNVGVRINRAKQKLKKQMQRNGNG